MISASATLNFSIASHRPDNSLFSGEYKGNIGGHSTIKLDSCLRIGNLQSELLYEPKNNLTYNVMRYIKAL